MGAALSKQRAGFLTLAFAIKKTHSGMSPTYVSRGNNKVASEVTEAQVLLGV